MIVMISLSTFARIEDLYEKIIIEVTGTFNCLSLFCFANSIEIIVVVGESLSSFS